MMKALYILPIALVTVTVLCFSGCTVEDTVSQEITVLRDLTDPHSSQPLTEEIQSMYGFEENKWRGRDFRFIDISDVDYNKVHQVHLKRANKWFSNEFARKSEIDTFQEGIKGILETAKSDTVGRSHSSVYIPLARELNKLSQSNTETRALLVYSDLMEKSALLDVYTAEHLEILNTNPDTVVTIFSRQVPLLDLTGIEVYFIFEPKDQEENNRFTAISGLYRRMLEDKGAKVEIGANLNF